MTEKICVDCDGKFKRLERINGKLRNRRNNIRCDVCSNIEKKIVLKS